MTEITAKIFDYASDIHAQDGQFCNFWRKFAGNKRLGLNNISPDWAFAKLYEHSYCDAYMFKMSRKNGYQIRYILRNFAYARSLLRNNYQPTDFKKQQGKSLDQY